MKQYLLWPVSILLLVSFQTSLAQTNPSRLDKLLSQKAIAKKKTNRSKAAVEAAQQLKPSTTSTGKSTNRKRKKPTTIRDHAFKKLLETALPLTPEQILELRRQQDESQRAVATTPKAPPRPVSATLTVDLSPGVTPPIIRLAAGFVTSLVFVDATGQPWPVVDYSLGNPKNFNIQWDKKTNTLFMQSTSVYATGNLAVRLQDLDTPVMISLVSGQSNVDYRVDMRIRARGPNAIAPIVQTNMPGAIHADLLNVLDGVPPPESQELDVSDDFSRAWLLTNKKLIFRTKLTVLSPAWSAVVSSPDGTRVYEMGNTPLILAISHGKTIKIQVKGL